MTTARECQWAAQVEASWLSLRSPGTGQGNGTVEVAAAPNPDPQNRRGAVLLNSERAEIVQAAGTCTFTLAQSSASFAQTGGTGSVDVRASSQLCTWTAASDVDWITLRAQGGQGSSSVVFDVAPTAGPPRSGELTVAGQTFSVTQSEGCTFSIAPTSHNAPIGGGTATVAVTTIAGCPWTASSNADWITIAQGSTGTGSGSVTFSVAPAAAAARTGTLVIAGQVFTVIQPGTGSAPPPGPPPPGPAPPPPPACAFVVVPTSHTFGADGGSGTVTVTAGAGCAWTASTTVPWIAIQGSTSGSSNGSVQFAVAATNGPSRNGTLTVAGQAVTVTQSQGCTFNIAPQTQSVPPAGGRGNVEVSAPPGCAWTASSNTSWLSLLSGQSGSGNGTVGFEAEATSGPSRSGSLTIAGRIFTVNQGTGCTFRLNPTSANVGKEGRQVEFDLETSDGCAWTASESTTWMSISTSTLSGTGSAKIRFAVLANSGPARTDVVTAGGQAFTVSQAAGCSYTLSASNQNVDAAGGSGSVGVSTAGGCTWDARSDADWIAITSGASGSGNGSVSFTAATNPGAPRSGTLTIAGQTFTIHQGQACTFTIAPERQPLDAAGGEVPVTVNAPPGCGWTAASQAEWISVVPTEGSGTGTVRVAVAANGGPPRTGTASIAGRTLTIEQGQACSFSISSERQTVAPGGGEVVVTVNAGPGCGWTAASQAEWISVTPAAGSGNGPVRVGVAANPGAPRTGTAIIAGRTLTIEQGQSCSFALDSTQQSIAATGGSLTVNVLAPAGCTWSAASQAPWITIPPGAGGNGNGAVQLAIDANAGAARSGTALIAGITFTVNQGSGCTFAVDPATIDAPHGGISSVRVRVTTDGACGWSASTPDPWISLAGGSSGPGSDGFDVTVAANAGPARSGSIAVADRTIPVTQQSGCTFTLSPVSQPSVSDGGPGSMTVIAGDGCAWTAVSQVSWIAVTSGSSGTGTAAVNYLVERNLTGAPRSGTILIAGQTFTVNQE